MDADRISTTRNVYVLYLPRFQLVDRLNPMISCALVGEAFPQPDIIRLLSSRIANQ